MDAGFSSRLGFHWTRATYFYSRKEISSATSILYWLSNRFLRMVHPLARLIPVDPESGELNVVIDTPKDSRNKYSWDEELELFSLTGVLPAGAVFPYDFGFIPNTKGGDGDPLDVLVLMDEPAFVGCLVRCRLLGAIEAKQTEKGKTNRNDRLIAVASDSRTHEKLKSITHLDPALLDEIEHFFISYNEAKGKKFRPLRRVGVKQAKQLVAQVRDSR